VASGPLILEFGSRSGSWFALCLFGTLLGVLGWGVAREIRVRSDRGGGIIARGLGLALFLVPLSLIYVSSLNGFYEAEVEGAVLRLRYLIPAVSSEIPLAEITDVRRTAWQRGKWRLVVDTDSGSTYESATSDREPVAESLARLRDAWKLQLRN
jgi:hypothetical protein